MHDRAGNLHVPKMKTYSVTINSDLDWSFSSHVQTRENTVHISSYNTCMYYFFVRSSTAGIIRNFTFIKMCLVRALSEIQVLFQGGPYMRKYSIFLGYNHIIGRGTTLSLLVTKLFTNLCFIDIFFAGIN